MISLTSLSSCWSVLNERVPMLLTGWLNIHLVTLVSNHNSSYFFCLSAFGITCNSVRQFSNMLRIYCRLFTVFDFQVWIGSSFLAGLNSYFCLRQDNSYDVIPFFLWSIVDLLVVVVSNSCMKDVYLFDIYILAIYLLLMNFPWTMMFHGSLLHMYSFSLKKNVFFFIFMFEYLCWGYAFSF